MRKVWCAMCGTGLMVPSDTAAGRAVQCASCQHIMPMPPRPQDRTAPTVPDALAATMHDEALETRKDIDAVTGPNRVSPIGPTTAVDRDDEPSVPTIPIIVAYDEEVTARRRAFDLDNEYKPKERTGAGIVNIADLGLEDDRDTKED